MMHTQVEGINKAGHTNPTAARIFVAISAPRPRTQLLQDQAE